MLVNRLGRYRVGGPQSLSQSPISHRRFQFRLSTLLWIMLAVACWFGGMATQRRWDRQTLDQRQIFSFYLGFTR
jgi:hypothetical protein